MKKILILGSIFMILGGAIASANSGPAIVPKAGDWTFDVRFENPEQIILEGNQSHQRYWYVILNLTNKSDKDVDFFPKCELVTDTLQVVPAVKGTSEVLRDKIKNRHQGRFPFLKLVEDADSKMLQGEDNALDIVVIFPDFDPNARTVNIFISGLANETIAVDHPIEKDQQGKPVKVYLRKTLQLTYSIAGDPAFRPEQKLKFVDKRWIMR